MCRSGGLGARGQEPILPAVLEFPEAGQAQFLAAVISRLDPHAPAFKLAPVYTLYLCARYRPTSTYSNYFVLLSANIQQIVRYTC